MREMNNTDTRNPIKFIPIDAVYTSYLGLIVFTGVLVNSLVAVATRRMQKQNKHINNTIQNTYHTLVFCNALIDGLSCAMQLLTIALYNDVQLLKNPLLCSLSGFFNVFCPAASATVVFITGINRYTVAVATLRGDTQSWSQRKTISFLATGILYCLLISILPLTPLTQYYETKLRSCYVQGAFGEDKAKRAVFLLITATKGTFTAASGIAYLCIYISYRSYRRRTGTGSREETEVAARARIAKEKKLTLIIFTAVAALYITRIPAGIIASVTSSEKWVLSGAMLLSSYHVIGPLLIGSMNTNYRKTIAQIFQKCC